MWPDLEHREAEAIVQLGGAWSPAAYRQLKDALADVEAEEKMLSAGLVALDEKMDALQAEVRDDIERRLNALRRPLVETVVQALDSIVEANRQLHGIEGLSLRLLQHSKHHLYDASLPHRLALMRRTAHLLALAAQPDTAA